MIVEQLHSPDDDVAPKGNRARVLRGWGGKSDTGARH